MQESFALTADWMLPETLLSSIIIKYQTWIIKHIGCSEAVVIISTKDIEKNVKRISDEIMPANYHFIVFFSIYDRYFQCLLFSIYLEIHLALKASSSVLYINDYLLSTSLSKHHYRHDHFKKSIPMEIDVVNLRRN